jgi:hypothetical protein
LIACNFQPVVEEVNIAGAAEKKFHSMIEQDALAAGLAGCRRPRRSARLARCPDAVRALAWPAHILERRYKAVARFGIIVAGSGRRDAGASTSDHDSR